MTAGAGLGAAGGLFAGQAGAFRTGAGVPNFRTTDDSDDYDDRAARRRARRNRFR